MARTFRGKWVGIDDPPDHLRPRAHLLMLYADALAATKGPWPITRTTADGYRMLGYLDGSVDVCKGKRTASKLSAGTGPALGYTNWEAGKL